MRRALAVGMLAMAMVACGGGGDRSDDPAGFTPVHAGAKETFHEAFTAMSNATSYHAVFTFPPMPRDDRMEVDFVKPDSYRIRLFSAEGTAKEQCPELPERAVFVGECPQVLTKITSRSLTEQIFVHEQQYSRRCEDVDVKCSDWRAGKGVAIPSGGPSPSYQPLWPIVALQFALPVSVAGQTTIDGETIVYAEGTVNHLRAILENEHRLAEAAGVASGSTVCMAEATPITIGENPVGSPPVGLENCHEQTYQESLDEQEPDLSFYDEHPANIAIQVLPESYLVRRMALAGEASPDHDANDRTTIIIEYSAFNNVTIEAPK